MMDVPRDAAASVSGELGRGAPTTPNVRPVESWRVTLAAGERVRVDLGASFDTFLRVHLPSGRVLENDDAAEGVLDSRVDFTTTVAGEYVIDATAYSPESRGTYRLTVTRGSAVPPPAPPTGPRLPVATTVAGALADGDHEVGGKLLDAFQFRGTRGDLVFIDLESTAFDTYLTVRSPDGQVYVSDDISGANLNSRVQATLSADGSYGVEVSSYGGGARGNYTLRLEQSARPTRIPNAPEISEVAGRTGHGRVFGVFVGIRDYGGENAALPNCDEDAIGLARTLRERGVQTASQQVVLTNGAATADAVKAAIATMATRVNADDLLIVFYSGHGGQRAGTVSVTEPDGLDETIVLRGATISDDEFAGWIAPVRGTVLVALDSCYSGGFARDVVAGPRRFGFFASEEDTLSDVASIYNAGGFLSYWLRLALGGAADVNEDATIRVGELSDYLYAQYAEHGSEMPTTSSGGGATIQHLVVARGSVANTDLLLRFPQ